MSSRPPPDVAAGAPGRLSAKAELLQHGLQPRRTLGQNFLLDQSLCDKIAKLTGPVGGSVLEIGAGLGALTGAVLGRGLRVLAIETDSALLPVLREKFAAELGSGQLELVHADVREVDLRSLLEGMPVPRTLAGNLPYHLSGLLLRRAVELADVVERSVFLLQLEVVERLCAEPDTANYGALTVFARSVYAPRRSFVVRRGAFYPQPGVDSAVVVLEPLEPPRPPPSDELALFVKAAFGKRRKTLRNAWRGILDLSMPELEELALAAGISLDARGETLGIDDFQRISALSRARRAEGQ